MAVIDELKILVTAEVNKAISDLNKVEKQTDKTGGSFKDFAKQVAGYTTGMGLAVDITKKVLSTMGDLGKESITLAAGFEKSRMAWGVFMADMGKGEEMFEQLFAFAAKTPLSFEAVNSAATTLKGFGIEAENLIPTMSKLGDVSMGDNEKLSRLALVFGQVKAQGKAMAQDLYQFVNAGVPIFQLLADTMGVTAGEIKDLGREGKITFEEIDKAINKATSQGGLFYQMMDKTAETTAGKWSTAQDNFKKVLADLGEKVIPIANRALDGFNKSMEMMGQKAILAEVLAGTKKDYDSIQIAIEAQRDVLEQISDDEIGLIGYEGNRTKAAQATLQRLEKQAEQSEKLGMAQRSARNAASAAATKEEEEARARAKAEADAIQAAKDRDKLDTETWLAANERGRGLIELAKQSGEAWNKAAEGTTEYVNGLSGVQNVGLKAFNDEEYWNKIAEGAYAYAESLGTVSEKTKEQIELEEQLKTVAESAMQGIGEALGQSLIDSEDGWEAFKDAAKDAMASVVEMFAKKWALLAVEAFIPGPTFNPAAGAGYIAASVAGYAGAGAIRAMANGGDFDTTGPTKLLVGESGREHVTVSPASRGGSSGGNITINIAGSLVSERQLNQTIRNAAAVRNR